MSDSYNNDVDVEQGMQERTKLEQWKLELIQIGRKNLDLVRFSKFLVFQHFVNMCDSTPEDSNNRFLYKMSPVFCSMKRQKHANNIFNRSRMEQSYKCNLYTDYSYCNSISLDNPWNQIVARCSNCILRDKEQEFCPYDYAAFVCYIAEKLHIPVMELFHMILGSYDIEFHFSKKIDVPEHAKPLLFSFDAKSARAAYLLLRFQLFSMSSMTKDTITYQYVPLCHTREKQSLVERITSFWKNPIDTFETLPAQNIVEFAKKKPDCLDCTFESCPHRVAAAFTVLGKCLNLNPMHLAHYVACNNTIANLTPHEHDQWIQFTDTINEIPLTPESEEEILNIIRYVVNRYKNPIAPMFPLNIVLHTGDEAIADQFFNAFFKALRFFDYFKNKNAVKNIDLSVATTSIEGLIKEYEAAEKGTVFHIKQIELLELSPAVDLLMPKLCRIMKEKEDVFTVVSGEREVLGGFFEEYPNLYYQTLKHHLTVKEMDQDAVFKNVLIKLEENFELEDEVARDLKNYIQKEYEEAELRSNLYVDWLHEKIVFNHFNNELGVSNILSKKDIPAVKTRRSEQEIFEELNRLTGLTDVKEKLNEINDLVKYFMKCDKKAKSRPNMHMVFAGNAGTGKTTVAKLMAEILYNIGFIRKNKLVVCSGKDLIGEYLGQTMHKTTQRCELAYDGILFIDEAYLLNPFTPGASVDTYKLDSINELIQQMENNRERLIVIFAGYTDEMREFVKHANPGLESRIATTLEFPDYSDEELIEIFIGISIKEGLHVKNDALEKVRELIGEARKSGNNFGNARFIRNLFERSLLLHARNTNDCEKGDSRLMELTKEDIDI